MTTEKEALMTSYENVFGVGSNQSRLVVRETRYPVLHVVENVEEMLKLLKHTLRQAALPVMCIGKPGNREAMLKAIDEYGVWVSEEVPEREWIMKSFKSGHEQLGSPTIVGI